MFREHEHGIHSIVPTATMVLRLDNDDATFSTCAKPSIEAQPLHYQVCKLLINLRGLSVMIARKRVIVSLTTWSSSERVFLGVSRKTWCLLIPIVGKKNPVVTRIVKEAQTAAKRNNYDLSQSKSRLPAVKSWRTLSLFSIHRSTNVISSASRMQKAHSAPRGCLRSK